MHDEDVVTCSLPFHAVYVLVAPYFEGNECILQCMMIGVSRHPMMYAT